MALAVAMKEWLTVITSSPSPTPAASSARCSAVVQVDTAHAGLAPAGLANSVSNAATSGPWADQPDGMTRAAAADSASPTSGFAIGTCVRTFAIGAFLRRGRQALALPPLDERRQTVMQRDRRFESQLFFRASHVGKAP